MSNPCSIPVVKGALLTLLQARSGLANVQVEWAWPGANKIANESVFFEDAKLDERSDQLGNGTRREDYTLPVYVCVKQKGNDPQTVETRAWALVAEIEAQLKPPNNADLGLGPSDGVKSLTVQVSGHEPHSYVQDEGWSCEIRVTLAVSARI